MPRAENITLFFRVDHAKGAREEKSFQRSCNKTHIPPNSAQAWWKGGRLAKHRGRLGADGLLSPSMRRLAWSWWTSGDMEPQLCSLTWFWMRAADFRSDSLSQHMMIRRTRCFLAGGKAGPPLSFMITHSTMNKPLEALAQNSTQHGLVSV